MVHLNHLPGHLGKDVGLTYISGYLRVWWNSWYVWDPRPCPGTMIFLDFYFFYVCSLTLLHRNQFPFYAILCKNVQKWTKVKNSSVFTNYGPNKSKNDQKRKIKKAQLPKSAYSLILDHCESGPVSSWLMSSTNTYYKRYHYQFDQRQHWVYDHKIDRQMRLGLYWRRLMLLPLQKESRRKRERLQINWFWPFWCIFSFVTFVLSFHAIF